MDFIFLGSKITVDSDCSHEIKQNKTKHLLLGRKCMIKPRQCIKKQRHHFADKGPNSQSYGFSSSHIWMWELDHEEDWVLKNWRLWIVALETRLFSSLKSPLDCKEIQPVHPKGNQSWIFIGSWSFSTLAACSEELTHWKRSWFWERLRAGGEGGNRGWDSLKASPTWWTWVWANSRRWWRTGKPQVLQSIESQRVRHYLVAEQQK